MHEQRLTVRLLKHWNMVRKEAHMPLQEQFTPDPIRDLWPNCFLVSVDTRAGIKFKYEYIGDAVIKIYGRDPTHQYVDVNAREFPGVIMSKKLQEVASEARPVEDEGFFINTAGKLIKYRACFLPLGADAKGITHIVVGLSFRQF